MKAVCDAVCTLGEGVLWDAERLCIWWIDIENRRLYRWDTVQESLQQLEFEQKIGCIALTDRHSLIAAMENCICEISVTGKIMHEIPFESQQEYTRANDGKPGPDGCLWLGSMSTRMQTGEAAFYRMSRDFGLEKQFGGVTVSNGLCWQQHNRQWIMYYIDTPTRQIEAFTFNAESSQISNRHTAVTIPDGLGYPDGMTIDSIGRLWVAMYAGAAVTIWDPESGTHLDSIEVPAPHATCVTFGGSDLCDVYITTAPEPGLEHTYPDAGKLFTTRSATAGTLPFVWGKKA